MFKHILIATDGSPASGRAARSGIALDQVFAGQELGRMPAPAARVDVAPLVAHR